MPSTAPRAPDDGRIPVCLLTGFLGAGKTTLLNRLMGHPEMAGTVLLINEFGEVGIDNHLVETLDDQTVILDSGCLCCTMNGDLIEALKSLHERMSRREIPPMRRVFIETTGLADPVPVVNTLMENRHVNVRYVCDGVVTVVDAKHLPLRLKDSKEAAEQIAFADQIILNKTDLVSEEYLLSLKFPFIPISADRNLNINMLKDAIYDRLELIRIYTKPRMGEADMKKPMMMRSGSNVSDACSKLHRDLVRDFKYAQVWGPSAKFPGQKVGIDHVLQDGDVVTIVKKQG